MATRTKRTSFGLHSAIMTDYVDPSIKCALKILGDFSYEGTPESVPLTGGSEQGKWATAQGLAEYTVTGTIKEYDPKALYYLDPSTDSSILLTEDGEPNGSIGTITNAVGTSVFDATTGIASIAATGTNMKMGNLAIKATAAGVVTIYSDMDNNGVEFVDDTLAVAEGVIIPDAGATVDVTELGITITGGSGTIAMVTDDVASVAILPPTSYLMQRKIGATGSKPRKFVLTIFGEITADNQVNTVTYHNCSCPGGAGLTYTAKDWSTFDATFELIKDSVTGCVATETYLTLAS